MTPELNKLDEKLIALEKALFEIKSSLDLYKIISINATEINALGRGKTFFGHVQRMSLDSYILGICKVFEEEKKKHEINSLPSILKTTKYCKPQNEQPLTDLINENRDLLGQRKENYGNPSIEDVEKIYKEFYQKYLIKDDRLKKMRDKIIAHSEYMEDVTRPKDVQSYDLMEKFLFFAIDMQSAINEAYLGVGSHPIKNDERVFSSTRAVLGKFGISNVKTKFDDE
ncbi:MAG: hypothetical protein ACETWQ_18060 [Phycisphaerae bacterium]